MYDLTLILTKKKKKHKMYFGVEQRIDSKPLSNLLKVH